MVSLAQEFEEIKESNNPEIINDFLIKLSETPNIDYFKMIEYFIEKLDAKVFEKIKLNLVFLIGEIGKLSSIDDKYLKILSEIYYASDRWVRDEVIRAIGKISENNVIKEDIIKLVGYGINDDYHPIRINALKTILGLDKIPTHTYRNIFLALNLKEKELEELCAKILNKHLSDYIQLFNILNYSENYKLCKQKAVRSLLLIYFHSPFNLESFRKKISTSNWEMEYKEIFLDEINTYEKILLKNI